MGRYCGADTGAAGDGFGAWAARCVMTWLDAAVARRATVQRKYVNRMLNSSAVDLQMISASWLGDAV